ncbi:hypothetical protein CEQ90_11610 [Lewinellaceae bacterium SD302]|nr:hypothetical protein CEQ90_11610 [Lewinellaceae bacterium SD302]
MNWFKQLTGFEETDAGTVRSKLELSGEYLVSKVNGRKMRCGNLEIPSLAELRTQTQGIAPGGRITVNEVIGDVAEYHRDPANANALFQAASQFNLLEMVSPAVTPEAGITGYEDDHTQGPACAIACGAGTIYRQYFVAVNKRPGQTADNQIDCLSELAHYLDNDRHNYWAVRNGYAFPTEDGIDRLTKTINASSPEEREQLLSRLQIGLQWNTEVTTSGDHHSVSQAYCSALPVLYSSIAPARWEAFARLVLEAAYEATFHAALLNRKRTGSNKLFLTLVGGGVFGNKDEWIGEAVLRSIRMFAHHDLDVKFISYGGSSELVGRIILTYRLASL